MTKYRLYIDEVGSADLNASSQNPNHRYLSLTGLIMDLDYVDKHVAPSIEKLKREYFGSHVDEPVILHRRELVQKKFPFQALKDDLAALCFDGDLLGLLDSIDYTVLTVVIDKFEHQQRYTVWRYDPYHYCLSVVVERFIQWLVRKAAVGDVMAESRGGGEDKRLKKSFAKLYNEGSNYVGKESFAQYLTSKQLKLKTKANNIAGLQMADLIAHPSFKATLARQQNQALPSGFGGLIARILEEKKYDRSPTGKVRGWGQKWLP